MSGSGRYYSQQQQYSLVENPPVTNPFTNPAHLEASRPSTPTHSQAYTSRPTTPYEERPRSATPSHVHDEEQHSGPYTQSTAYDSHTAYDSRPAAPPAYRGGYDYFDSNTNPLKPARHTPASGAGFLGWRSSTGVLGWRSWSKKRKYIIFGSSAATILLLIIIIAAAVAVSQNSFSYTPSFAHVTNSQAFASGPGVGGATHANPNNTADGIGAGSDTYTYYQGDPTNFPEVSAWVSFEDMWAANKHTLQTSCSLLGYGADNTEEQIQDIYDSIQNRASVSLVDHRFILAVIMQESHGCIHVSATANGVSNPGLMQSHNGHAFSTSHSSESILAMVQDGTQGTSSGDGLVQNLNLYGDWASAARAYNSGYIPKSGDLSEAAGATACYVSDIGNRLTGWVHAKSKCPGDHGVRGGS